MEFFKRSVLAHVCVSGSSDKTVRVWDTNNLECLGVMTLHKVSLAYFICKAINLIQNFVKQTGGSYRRFVVPVGVGSSGIRR